MRRRGGSFPYGRGAGGFVRRWWCDRYRWVGTIGTVGARACGRQFLPVVDPYRGVVDAKRPAQLIAALGIDRAHGDDVFDRLTQQQQHDAGGVVHRAREEAA